MKRTFKHFLALLPCFLGSLLSGALTAQENPSFTTLHQSLQQGGFLIGQTAPGSLVTLNDNKAMPVSDNGTFVVGFDRNATIASTLKICKADKTCKTTPLTLQERTWVTQNVTKIPKETVNPSPEQEKVVEQDNVATTAARTGAVREANMLTAYARLFQLPIKAETSGVFGSRRTFNGEERSWHKGHDLAAKTGTPVHAPADGIVRLARHTFMSGNLILLDHGGGITTLYAHLSKMNVNVGDEVKTGDVIGLVGTTGRSSGPHLHWGTYWQNTAIDPILWVQGQSAQKGK